MAWTLILTIDIYCAFIDLWERFFFKAIEHLLVEERILLSVIYFEVTRKSNIDRKLKLYLDILNVKLMKQWTTYRYGKAQEVSCKS